MFCLSPQYIFNNHWSAVWCFPKICPWAPLIYLLLSFAVLLSTHFFFCVFADTIKIACSTISATDSTLPQPDIDSICCHSATGFMELDTEKCKGQCWLCIALMKQNFRACTYFLLHFFYWMFPIVILHPSYS